MHLILITGIAIFAYFYFLKKTAHLSAEKRKEVRKKWLLAGGVILLAMIAFAKGQVIIGAIASVVAMIMRGLPLLKYFPALAALFGLSTASTQPASDNKKTMSKAEAAEVLGVNEDASIADIVAAHKRLIQKVHPDKGGSELLAAQINQAKKVLLD